MPPSEQAGHERRDIPARGMMRLVLGMVAMGVLVVAASLMLLRLMQRDRLADLPRLPAEQTVQGPPPAPRLEAHPAADFARLRARENGLLDHYAWLGDDHARARIPITRAMALIVGRGLDAPK